MHKLTRTTLGAFVALAIAASTSSALAPVSNTSKSDVAAAELPHLRLKKSDPAEKAAVNSPTEIRLWFTERPELAATRVTVTNANGAAVNLGKLTRSDEADSPIIAAVSDALKDGVYKVEWRTMSKDGHPVRGTFQFTVKATS